MADLEQKNTDLANTSGSMAPDAPKTQPEKPKIENQEPEKEKKRAFVSKGEKIHHWSTYLGVDWLYNTTVGVAFAYAGEVTAIGKRFWSGPIKGFFRKTLGTFIKNSESLEHSVNRGNMFVSIISGGMLTIPLLMGLENNKVKKSIVQFFDRRIYGNDAVENDPKFQQAYKEIDEAPKKDFWNGMWSRFAALAPLLTFTVFIPKTRDAIWNNYFEPISKFSEKTAIKLGFTGEKLKTIPAGKGSNAWKFVHDNVAFDLAQALPYAPLHAFFYNMFTKTQNKKNANNPTQGENSTTPVAQEPTAATGEATQAQPARSFVGKISTDVNIVGRPAAISHDSFTDFANDTDKKLQVSL